MRDIPTLLARERKRWRGFRRRDRCIRYDLASKEGELMQSELAPESKHLVLVRENQDDLMDVELRELRGRLVIANLETDGK